MKCPKCGYTSFPYLESCRKCGYGLAEQRAALGVYALRPDPPDLLLAYQAANVEVPGGTLTQSPSEPSIDLGRLDEIELELAEAGQAGPDTHEVGQQADAPADLIPTLDLESTGEGELPPVASRAEQVSSQDVPMPPSVNLGELGDITLELENAPDLRGKSPESAQTPRESPEPKPVYDLDLDADLDDLPLGAPVDESRPDDDEEMAEYTLEIEDEFELEVDELEIEEGDEAEEDDEAEEEDDEAEEEDDDDR